MTVTVCAACEVVRSYASVAERDIFGVLLTGVEMFKFGFSFTSLTNSLLQC